MRGHAKTAVGIVLTVVLLGWALRDVSPATVVHEVRSADPLLFVLAILLQLAGFAFRAWRWGVLLRPVRAGVAFRPRFAAIVVGFAANNVLPARVGEFARVLTLGRIARVPLAAGFATLVVERIFDGLILVGLLFAAMAAASFPAVGTVGGVDPRHAALVVAGLMGVVGVALFLLVVAPGWSLRVAEGVLGRVAPERVRGPVVAALHSFLGGLEVLRSGPLFLLSLLLAVGQWLSGAAAFLLGFRAFGIDGVPFMGAVFLQSLVSLAVAVPSSPGFFGPFEFAATFGLGLWGVAAEKAASFAVGFHLGGFLPTTLMGMYYLWRLGLSWSEVKHSEEVVEARVGADEEAPVAAPERG